MSESEKPAGSLPSSEATVPAADVPAVAEATNVSASEGLPEWEPLTPELVEDEAIRGDFMLRWAVVFLALLVGCRQIVETTTLVHVKTGQYLASHGLWPPEKDVFSATATEQRWVNLSWLWDAITAGLFSVGQGIGLSLATALLVAVTWWLLGKTTREHVSTWWGSLLGALTLLACHSQFSGQPETVTLLGLAATLWCLNAWQSTTDSATSTSVVAVKRPMSLWWLAPGFALWSNLDERMFLGLLLLLLWGIGEFISHELRREVLTSAQRKHFWTVLGTCVVATFLSPFGGRSLWSPVLLYGTEYPAWHLYAVPGSAPEDAGKFSLLTADVWSAGPGRLPLMAGIVVLVSAFITFILNARRTNLGEVLALIAFTGLACVASHELAAASVVACVFGTLNAQQWYQSSFRQTYSIANSELLFTRGGRAVTVLAFFVLAVMSVNQSLFGVDGKRVGLGLSNDLRALIDAYREATADSLDDRPFNFVPRQGDVLLWLGQRPFIDSRLLVFAGRGDRDLLALHDDARRSLAGLLDQEISANEGLKPNAAEAPSQNWKPILDRFQITHAMPRLISARPIAYFRMLVSPDWTLTHLGANCAVFYRRDNASAELQQFVDQHRLQFQKLAFQSNEPPALRNDWPRLRTFFQRSLSPPAAHASNKVMEAANLLMHLHAMRDGHLSMEQPTSVAMAHLAIRKANAGLAESVDDAAAYQILGELYSFLLSVETSIVQSEGLPFSNQLRFYQALGAYYQAIVLQPNSILIRDRLLDLLRRHNRFDLVLRELQAIEELSSKAHVDEVEDQEAKQRRESLRENCESRLAALREQLDPALDQGQNPLQLAQQVYSAGFVLEALKLLDRDREEVDQSPELQALKGLLRFEAGSVEEVHGQFEYESESNVSAWRVPAAWARLAHGEYDRAIDIWRQQLEMTRRSSVSAILATLPLIQSPFHALGRPAVWPVQHGLTFGNAQRLSANETASLLWYIAMSQLEAGNPQLASKTLDGLLDANPDTPFRPLIRFYLFLMTDELIDVEPPSEWIPIDGDIFMPDEAAATQK